jgi:hypothetical protein
MAVKNLRCAWQLTIATKSLRFKTCFGFVKRYQTQYLVAVSKTGFVDSDVLFLIYQVLMRIQQQAQNISLILWNLD